MCFKNDLTATQAADICGVNRYYGLLRRAILSEARREIGEYELDESYFRARAWEAGTRGGRKDASVRAAQARGEDVRDSGTELLAGVADADYQRVNS